MRSAPLLLLALVSPVLLPAAGAEARPQLLPADVPGPGTPRAAATALSAAPTPSTPVIEAVGVVRTADPGRCVAILRAEGRTRVVTVGETAFGARLVSATPEGIRLDVGGRSVDLRLSQAPAPPRLVGRPEVASAELPPEDPATPAREMDRRQVQMRLADEMSQILANTAIAPVLEDGHVVGVQLTRVPEGSLLTDAGLRQGDVLTRINDTQIDGMGTLIGLWPRLQNATDLRAVVLRGGQPVSVHVSLR